MENTNPEMSIKIYSKAILRGGEGIKDSLMGTLVYPDQEELPRFCPSDRQ